MSFVLGSSNLNSETTMTSPAAIFSENARANASCMTLRLTFCEKSRGLGPCATPPPRHTGD